MLLGFTVIGMFQPELRRMLERFGNKKYHKTFFRRSKKVNKNFSDKTLQELSSAAYMLGKAKTGALIVIEKGTPLNDFIATGTQINGELTSALLINIFEKNTPLHDGAVIVRNDTIVSATCYLPLSNNPEISKELGTRHRAAIGLSETVDCFVIIVSEETGAVSVVCNGKLIRNIKRDDFEKILKRLQTTDYGGLNIPNKHETKNFLKKNIAKKIVSVAIGIVLWFSLINITNPITTKNFYKIPIVVTNVSNLSDINKTYSIEEGQTVDLVLKGHRTALEQLKEDDISVTVDVSKLSSVNTSEIHISLPDNIEVISKSKNTVSVDIDNVAHAEWPVEIEQTGTVKSGFWVSGIELDNETLLISGPEMLLNKIDQVKVSVNVSNKEDGAVTNVSPVIYDKNGDVMDTSKFQFNSDSINATIHLYKTKIIDLNIKTVDEKGSQGKISKISFEPTQIAIAAPDSVLNKIDSLDIEVPVKIDITTNNGTQLSKTINIDDFIPENVIFASNEKKLTITVDFIPFAKKEVELNSSSIKFTNIPAGKKVAVVNPQEYKAIVIAPEKTMANLKTSQISAVVNLNGYKNANYDVSPSLSCPGYYVYTSDKININIK